MNTFIGKYGPIHVVRMIQLSPVDVIVAECGFKHVGKYEIKKGRITCEHCISLIRNFHIDRYWRKWGV